MERSRKLVTDSGPIVLLLGGFVALGRIAQEQIDLLVAANLRGLGQAIAAAQRDFHAGDVDRLVGSHRATGQRALDLLQLAALNELQIGLAGELRRVGLKGHGAFLAAELNLAAVEIDRLIGFGWLARDGALQSRLFVGGTQRIRNNQSEDSESCYCKATFHGDRPFE